MTQISPDDWRRLEPWFDRLLDLAPAERNDWLVANDDLTDSDRHQLRNLLQAHELAGGTLEQALPQSASRLVAESMADPLVGAVLGPFAVGEELGRGGMGVVYRGRRTDGEFEQEVVIKVLRLGVDSEDTRRRFLQERQILANLNHPAIVRLLDGGVTPDGRPYIVMPRVVGQRIDEYCDGQQLTVQARVRLFLNVVEAVDHAHRHLVIHRDLKPSNVWVDKSGKVHLLDFGIARITGEEGTAGMTAPHQHIMTPEYASPEQFRQEEVTTASDVYQLGVLLYRLLTGCYPHDLEGNTMSEMERRVCHEDPPSASRAITRDDADHPVAQTSVSRGTTPARLGKELRGDLDLILQMALRKEPERRYQSAHEFRGDLIHWLSGERILARPDSLGYQWRRFVRRNPVGVALAATVLVCSVGFSLFHMQRMTVERNIARTEAARHKEVSDFLVNLLRVPDPTTAAGREITARELLADSFPRINEDLSDTETKVRLLQVVGEVANNLGLYDQAGPALANVVIYTSELYGDRSLETAAAEIELAEMLRLSQAHEKAVGPAENALSIRRELLPAGDLGIAEALRVVALAHRDQRDFERAEVELRAALDIYAAQLPQNDKVRIAAQVDLAYVLRTVKKEDEAEALYRETIPALRNRSAEFPQALPGALNNLAYLLRKKGEYAEAEVIYREAIERNESYYGEAHPSTLMFRNNLAVVLRELGKMTETRQELTTIIEQQEHLAGTEHWRTGTAHRALGYFLFVIEDYAAAGVELSAAYNNFSNGLGADHLWTAAAAAQLATVLHLNGERSAANQLWRKNRPLLVSEAARSDANVQRTLHLMVENMPAEGDVWRQKLSEVMAESD